MPKARVASAREASSSSRNRSSVSGARLSAEDDPARLAELQHLSPSELVTIRYRIERCSQHCYDCSSESLVSVICPNSERLSVR